VSRVVAAAAAEAAEAASLAQQRWQHQSRLPASIRVLKLAGGLCAFADGTLNVVHVLVSTALAGITQVGQATNT
jgi:hypothetical protein